MHTNDANSVFVLYNVAQGMLLWQYVTTVFVDYISTIVLNLKHKDILTDQNAIQYFLGIIDADICDKMGILKDEVQ